MTTVTEGELGANAMAAPEDESTLASKFEATLGVNNVPPEDVEHVRSWFMLGAQALMESFKEIQPADNKLSTIITTAGQVANLETEIEDYFTQADDDTVLG